MPLINDYKLCCNIRNRYYEKDILDMSGIQFVTPIHNVLMTSLLFDAVDKEKKVIPPISEKVRKYYANMLTSRSISSSKAIPHIILPKDKSELVPLHKRIMAMFDNGAHTGGRLPTYYLIDELTNNIYDHSEFSYASIAGQKYCDHAILALYDNGITIPGNYEKHSVHFDSDEDAVYKALSGISTKKEGGRGFGLITCKCLLENVTAELLILSRNGGVHIDDKTGNVTPLLLSDTFKIDGTLICIEGRNKKQISREDFYKIVDMETKR